MATNALIAALRANSPNAARQASGPVKLSYPWMRNTTETSFTLPPTYDTTPSTPRKKLVEETLVKKEPVKELDQGYWYDFPSEMGGGRVWIPNASKPVATPVTSPVKTTVTTPVKTPVTTPVKTPVTQPVLTTGKWDIDKGWMPGTDGKGPYDDPLLGLYDIDGGFTPFNTPVKTKGKWDIDKGWMPGTDGKGPYDDQLLGLWDIDKGFTPFNK